MTTFDDDTPPPFADWLAERIDALTARELPMTEIVSRICGDMPTRYHDQVLRGGVGARVRSAMRHRGFIPDYSREDAPQVHADEATLPGMAEWVIAQQDNIAADVAALERQIDDWCKKTGTDRAVLDAEVTRRRGEAERAAS